jgi:hypothetical protein
MRAVRGVGRENGAEGPGGADGDGRHGSQKREFSEHLADAPAAGSEIGHTR